MKPLILLLGLSAVVFLCSCSEATRATVHQEDMVKVFPWPAHQEKITIRAKPQTTAANMCIWLGSYQDVEVLPDTTFYLVDETDQNFAYTPARSPMRRLAKIKFMEIRWPHKGATQEAAPKGDGGKQPSEAKESKESNESKQPASKPVPSK